MFLVPNLRTEDVLHAAPLLEPVQPRPISREECKQQAHEEATTLFNAHNEIATPPEPVPVNGLYILITETDEQWVPKDLLDDPDACMQYLHKQLEDGTIGQRIGSAFGQWYLYGNAQVFSSLAMFSCYTIVLCFIVLLFYKGVILFQSSMKDIDNGLFAVSNAEHKDS